MCEATLDAAGRYYLTSCCTPWRHPASLPPKAPQVGSWTDADLAQAPRWGADGRGYAVTADGGIGRDPWRAPTEVLLRPAVNGAARPAGCVCLRGPSRGGSHDHPDCQPRPRPPSAVLVRHGRACRSAPAAGGAARRTERIVTSALLAGGGAAVDHDGPDGSGVARRRGPGGPRRTSTRPPGRTTARGCCTATSLVFDDSGELVAFRPAISAADGSDYRLLRMRWRPMDFYCSAWSPDDSRILCSNHDGSIISIRASDGRGARQLTENPYGGQDLAVGYSPDGSRLAWLRERPGATDEARARRPSSSPTPTGRNARRVTRWGLLLDPELAGANWSPDGTAHRLRHAEGPAGRDRRRRGRGDADPGRSAGRATSP